MTLRPDHSDPRDPRQSREQTPSGSDLEGSLDDSLKPFASMLDARGRRHRDGLSDEALDRIVAMSDLQLPIAGSEEPLVLARIEPSRTGWVGARSIWRLAAAIAVLVGIGTAVLFAWRGLGGGSTPSEGTLAEGTTGPSPRVDVPTSAPALSPKHLEHALAVGSPSATAVVVALSGAGDEPAMHYHDLDDSLAADIAPLFHAGSLLDGSGLNYQDLSGEFAAIVGPASFH